MLVVNGLVFGLFDSVWCKFLWLLLLIGFSDGVCVVLGVFKWIMFGFGIFIMFI